MPAKVHQGQDARLFSYVISSADMRDIEREERAVYLRHLPDEGPVIRGEIPECGPGCHANLGHVLLEYVMSCEGCREPELIDEYVGHFAERLGKALVKRISQPSADASADDHVDVVFQCLMSSLGVPFTANRSADELHYRLDGEPVEQAAKESGIHRGLPEARRAFAALCDSALQSLGSNWQLVQSSDAADESLREIKLAKVDSLT